MRLTAQQSQDFNAALREYERNRYTTLYGNQPQQTTASQPVSHRPSDNEVADVLMHQMRGVITAPSQLYQQWDAAYERLQRLRSRAYSIPPVRYDKDRVMSSNISDLSDTVDIIMQAEQAEFALRMAYIGALGSLDYVMGAARFDRTTQRIWRLYYSGKGYTMDEVAARLGLTRAQVKYALNKVNNRVRICLAIDRIAEDNTPNQDNQDDYKED